MWHLTYSDMLGGLYYDQPLCSWLGKGQGSIRNHSFHPSLWAAYAKDAHNQNHFNEELFVLLSPLKWIYMETEMCKKTGPGCSIGPFNTLGFCTILMAMATADPSMLHTAPEETAPTQYNFFSCTVAVDSLLHEALCKLVWCILESPTRGTCYWENLLWFGSWKELSCSFLPCYSRQHLK